MKHQGYLTAIDRGRKNGGDNERPPPRVPRVAAPHGLKVVKQMLYGKDLVREVVDLGVRVAPCRKPARSLVRRAEHHRIREDLCRCPPRSRCSVVCVKVSWRIQSRYTVSQIRARKSTRNDGRAAVIHHANLRTDSPPYSDCKNV